MGKHLKLSTANLIERQVTQVTKFVNNSLTKKFCLPISISEQAAQAIAYSTILGRCGEIWLNGELVSLQKVNLTIQVKVQEIQNQSEFQIDQEKILQNN